MYFVEAFSSLIGLLSRSTSQAIVFPFCVLTLIVIEGYRSDRRELLAVQGSRIQLRLGTEQLTSSSQLSLGKVSGRIVSGHYDFEKVKGTFFVKLEEKRRADRCGETGSFALDRAGTTS